MEKSTFKWFVSRINHGGLVSKKQLNELVEQAEEIEKKYNISLLEWIRENAVEVQDGWQYLGKAYTDKQIIEMYNKTFKSK